MIAMPVIDFLSIGRVTVSDMLEFAVHPTSRFGVGFDIVIDGVVVDVVNPSDLFSLTPLLVPNLMFLQYSQQPRAALSDGLRMLSRSTVVQSNPDIRMPSGDSKIKDIVRYPYIESDVN